MMEAVQEAGRSRLRPVLMTAITTIVAWCLWHLKGQGRELNPWRHYHGRFAGFDYCNAGACAGYLQSLNVALNRRVARKLNNHHGSR